MVVTGHFTRDIEVKTVGEHKVVENAVASNEGRDKTTFMEVKIWNKQAELVEKYLSKGSFVIVSGRVEQENWEKDGQKRSKLVLVASNVELGPKVESGGGGGAAEKPAAQAKKTAAKGKDSYFDDDDSAF